MGATFAHLAHKAGKRCLVVEKRDHTGGNVYCREVEGILDGRAPSNLEEQAMTLVGRDIYGTLIKGYTEKQWGRACTELPAFIIRRLPRSKMLSLPVDLPNTATMTWHPQSNVLCNCGRAKNSNKIWLFTQITLTLHPHLRNSADEWLLFDKQV